MPDVEICNNLLPVRAWNDAWGPGAAACAAAALLFKSRACCDAHDRPASLPNLGAYVRKSRGWLGSAFRWLTRRQRARPARQAFGPSLDVKGHTCTQRQQLAERVAGTVWWEGDGNGQSYELCLSFLLYLLWISNSKSRHWQQVWRYLVEDSRFTWAQQIILNNNCYFGGWSWLSSKCGRQIGDMQYHTYNVLLFAIYSIPLGMLLIWHVRVVSNGWRFRAEAPWAELLYVQCEWYAAIFFYSLLCTWNNINYNFILLWLLRLAGAYILVWSKKRIKVNDSASRAIICDDPLRDGTNACGNAVKEGMNYAIMLRYRIRFTAEFGFR